MLSQNEQKLLKAKARLIEPMIRVGKNGLTDALAEHIVLLLKKRKLVKVKFLRSFIEENDRKDAAVNLAKATNSDLVDQVGFVVVLYKR